jgi:hypothetical protein
VDRAVPSSRAQVLRGGGGKRCGPHNRPVWRRNLHGGSVRRCREVPHGRYPSFPAPLFLLLLHRADPCRGGSGNGANHQVGSPHSTRGRRGRRGKVGGVNRVESLGSARLRFCCKPIHIVFVCMRCVWLQVGPCFLCQELQPKLLDMNETGLAQQIDMAWLLGEEYGYLSVHHSAHRVCPPSKIFFLKKTLTMLHIGFCQIAR